MPMNTTFLNAVADHGGTIVTSIGLVNSSGTELSGGSYARQPVTWTAASAGLIRPTANLVFNIPASTNVGGWRGFSAGGVDQGGANLTTETFTNAGTYTLLAASTAIDFDAT